MKQEVLFIILKEKLFRPNIIHILLNHFLPQHCKPPRYILKADNVKSAQTAFLENYNSEVKNRSNMKVGKK